jgi:hypothetical protein
LIDKDYLLEHITEEQILQLLARFGAVPYGAIKEKEIWFQTICHGGDSHKLCYFRDTKTFYCYTNCGQMSLFNLIMKVKNCTFSEAIKFVANEIGISNRYGFNNTIPMISQELLKIDKYIQLRKPKKTEIKHLPKIDGKILNYFEDDVFYTGWIDEGISIETMQEFGIRWYELEKHIIIPHYNINGELVGIRRRSLQEKDKNNKYMPEMIEGITYTHSLNLNLYGLDKHMKGILKTKKVVIAESEKSVMLAHEYYGEDAFVVATCGFNISNWHRDVLLSLGVEEVMLAFDRDYDLLSFTDVDEEDLEYKKCKRYVNRINSLARKLTPYFTVYILYDYEGLTGLKCSPFDCGKEILEKIMKQKTEVTTNSVMESED